MDQSEFSKQIRDSLDGVTDLDEVCYNLARHAVELGYEKTEDGNILLIPEPGHSTRVTVVDMRHGKIKVYSDQDRNREDLEVIGHRDHWIRAMMWAVASGASEEDAKERLGNMAKLTSLVKAAYKVLAPAYQEVFDKKPPKHPLSLGVSEVGLSDDKIGRHENLGGRSVITVHPNAFNNTDYLEDVVNHEVIHFLLATHKVDSHGDEFHYLADEVNLPDKYRD